MFLISCPDKMKKTKMQWNKKGKKMALMMLGEVKEIFKLLKAKF